MICEDVEEHNDNLKGDETMSLGETLGPTNNGCALAWRITLRVSIRILNLPVSLPCEQDMQSML